MQLDVDLGDLGVDRSPSDVVMSCLRLQEASDWTSQLLDVYKVFWHLDMV